jgi:hypothetical protein
MYFKKVKSKNFEEKKIFFVGILPATDEKARSGSRVGPESLQKLKNVTDPHTISSFFTFYRIYHGHVNMR